MKFKSFLLEKLSVLYHKHNLVMQLHIGAMRDNSERMLAKIGPNTGYDSIDDVVQELSSFMNLLDKDNNLPKTVLYCLNPKGLRYAGSGCR